MVTRLLRYPIPDQRHRAHADGKRAEQAAFFVPADEQGGEDVYKRQGCPGWARNGHRTRPERRLSLIHI